MKPVESTKQLSPRIVNPAISEHSRTCRPLNNTHILERQEMKLLAAFPDLLAGVGLLIAVVLLFIQLTTIVSIEESYDADNPFVLRFMVVGR